MASEATEHGATDSGLTMPKFGELDLEQLVNEPLLPELEPYLRHETAFGTSLHHPLVIEPIAVLSGLANRIYTSKTWALKKAIEDQDWSTVVLIVLTPLPPRSLRRARPERASDPACRPLPRAKSTRHRNLVRLREPLRNENVSADSTPIQA